MSERRDLGFESAEFRFADGDKRTLEGYASIYGVSYDLGRFDEVVETGAFSRALTEAQDVRALIDHDPARIIGRSKNGTLEMREDNKGLFTRIHLPDTQEARDLATLVERGDLDAMSFGFTVKSDRWENNEGRNTRYISDVDIFDISVVAFPASPTTSVALRSMEAAEAEIEADHRRRRFSLMLLGLRVNTWRKS
jgi:HK97 family phage prohead protease